MKNSSVYRFGFMIRFIIFILSKALLKQIMSLSIFGGGNQGSFLSQDREQNRQNTPNNTIYINNLNEKVPIEELKDTLFTIFEQYGDIIDIIAKRNIRMRGQAFIIFRDINSAMEARRRNNGRQLYGKTMKILFAREKSDVIAKIDGTFVIRDKSQNDFKQKFEEKFIHRPQQLRAKVQREKNILKKMESSSNPPNHILFCQGLDQNTTAEMLTEVFMRFPGLTDVRLAPKNYAFIEYEDEFKAGNALAALNETQIGSITLRLSYAKK